jgi:hypothetical protein
MTLTKEFKKEQLRGALAQVQGKREENTNRKATGMRASATTQPNLFELKGGYMKITYSSSSFSGKPLLTYEDAEGRHQFMGKDEVRQMDTDIGRLVTVSTDQIHGTTVKGAILTVLIPIFNFKGREMPFTTWAIFTTDQSVPGGSESSGEAVQTYSVEQLTGTAQHAVF